MSDEMDELPELDALMRAERKHDWMSEPRFKRMFDDIEDGLQGVAARGDVGPKVSDMASKCFGLGSSPYDQLPSSRVTARAPL